MPLDAGTPNAATVDEVEHPNPSAGTNNWYTEDGYGGGLLYKLRGDNPTGNWASRDLPPRAGAPDSPELRSRPLLPSE